MQASIVITRMLETLIQDPRQETLLSICTQLELLDTFAPRKEEVKSLAMKAIMRINESAQGLAADEHMLRLYQIVGKYSRTMGGSGVMEKLETGGQFQKSLKFHVMWAEAKAKDSCSVGEFERIIQLARQRLAHLDKDVVENSLRDVASELMPSALHLFTPSADEETAILFKSGQSRKSRRRSSVAHLQKVAEVIASEPKHDAQAQQQHGTGGVNPVFGKNTNTRVRRLLIERPEDGYVGISAEEYREAMLKDQQDMHFHEPALDDMEISFQQNLQSAELPPTAAAAPSSDMHQQNRRVLQALSEKEEEEISEGPDDKKMRFFSPAKPLAQARFSSKSDASVSKSSDRSMEIAPLKDEQLDFSRPASRPESAQCPGSVSSAAETLPASSISISEHYAKADYVFSETINARKANLLSEETDIAPPTQHISAAPFQVYVDEMTEELKDVKMLSKEHDSKAMEMLKGGEGDKEEAENFAGKTYNKPASGLRALPSAVVNDTYDIRDTEEEKGFVAPQAPVELPKRHPLREVASPKKTQTSTPKVKAGSDESCVPSKSSYQLKEQQKAVERVEETTSMQQARELIELQQARARQADAEATVNREKVDFLADDDTVMAGLQLVGNQKRISSGIVTSTPAIGKLVKPTHEDFLAMRDDEDSSDEESTGEQTMGGERTNTRAEESVDPFKGSAFMQRRSMAANRLQQQSVPSQFRPSQATAPVAASQPLASNRQKTLERDVKIKLNLNDNDAMEKEKDVQMGQDEMMDDDENQDDDPHERTGVGLDSIITSALNPWDRKLRESLLKKVSKPAGQIHHKEPCPKVTVSRHITIGGRRLIVQNLLGEGGFARVFKAQLLPEGTITAVKYEVPSCEWEAYICSEVRSRIQRESTNILPSIMQIKEAHIFQSGSLLFNEFLPLGSLLDAINRLSDPHWSLAILVSIHIARILQAVHHAQMIHADIKPDNLMVLRKLGAEDSVEDLLRKPLLRLIDWGRAIDMKFFEPGTTFEGKAGTTSFDSPEMQDGRPWSYQTDFFGFAMTIGTFVTGRYPELVGDKLGEYALSANIKRRNDARPLLLSIFGQCCNIASSGELPDWDKIIAELESFFTTRFDRVEWRNAATKFNAALPTA